MTAEVPRERRIGQINFVRNNFGQDLVSPNFPLLDYEWLVLRLSGSVTVSGGTTDGTVGVEAPFSLVKSIQVVVTGLTGDTFVDIPMSELRVITHMIGRRPALEPKFAAPAATVGTNTFFAEVYLPFALEDMSNPYRGFFASNRYGQVRLRIQWGNEEDLINGGDRTEVVDATTLIEVFGREYSYNPTFELANDLLLNQRVFVKDISINNSAQTNFEIEIPRTASFLRGILLKQFVQTTFEQPINTLINGDQQVTLLYNDLDRKYEYKWNQLTRQNFEMYRGDFPLVGGLPFYAFLDLSPRGDFARLQNMLNLQKIAIRVDNNAVANAFLRVVLLKYALSA